MGYTTEFRGKFEFDRYLTEKEKKILDVFHDTRHVKRDVTPYFENPEIFGQEGELFCIWGGKPYYPGKEKPIIKKGIRQNFKTLANFYNGLHGVTIKNNNQCPKSTPGLWCQWRVTDDRKFLEWDGSEKFYSYELWLDYLIRKFFTPMNLFITGVVHYRGESFEDHGRIVAYHNMFKKYPDDMNTDIDWDVVEDIQRLYTQEDKLDE